MAIEYTVIGRHIRAAQKQKRLTQEDVADMIDMSPAHFGKVERGERPVNLQRLSQLSQALDVPLEKLISSHCNPTFCFPSACMSTAGDAQADGTEQRWRSCILVHAALFAKGIGTGLPAVRNMVQSVGWE